MHDTHEEKRGGEILRLVYLCIASYSLERMMKSYGVITPSHSIRTKEQSELDDRHKAPTDRVVHDH